MTTSPDGRTLSFFFFLIGTENVKQNQIILNENTTVLKWRQLMRNKWANASERTRETAVITCDCSGRHREAGGVSMHLTLMFQLCNAQSQNQTGHEIEEAERDSSHFTPEGSSDEHKETQQHDTVIGLRWHKVINQLASDSCSVHLHKTNKVYATQEIGIIRSQQSVVTQKPLTRRF